MSADDYIFLLLIKFISNSFVSRMTQTPERGQALDLLPAISGSKPEIFIKVIDDRAISWAAFLNPFSHDTWIVLLFVAAIISCFLTLNERFFGPSKDVDVFVNHYLRNLWVAFKANAGGRPSSIKKNTSYKIVLFDCLLVGSVVWMAYRASFTSELSVKKLKLPFNDLESLSKTSYR